jgi:hypothetical protein
MRNRAAILIHPAQLSAVKNERAFYNMKKTLQLIALIALIPSAIAATTIGRAGSGVTGVVTEIMFSFSDNTTANATTARHGLLPKLLGGSSAFLREDGAWALPMNNLNSLDGGGIIAGRKYLGSYQISNPENTYYDSRFFFDTATVTLSIGDVNIRGDGLITAPAGSLLIIDDIGLQNMADTTTGNATTTAHGFLPKLSGNSAHFLDGDGNWSTPAGGGNVTATPTTGATGKIPKFTDAAGTDIEPSSITESGGTVTINADVVVTGSITGTGVTSSGTYVPTIANVFNTSVGGSSVPAHGLFWTRIGNLVTVTGVVAYQPLSASPGIASSFTITLPVAATFSFFSELSGVGVFKATPYSTSGIPVSILATAPGGNTAVFQFVSPAPAASGTQSLRFSFTYTL